MGRHQKFLLYGVLLAIVVIGYLAISNNNKRAQTLGGNPTFEEIVGKYTDTGWQVIDDQMGQLNNDSYEDRLVVLDTDDKKVPNDRMLLVLFGQPNSTYTISATSDSAIPCSECGGAMGDPYGGVEIKDKKIIISSSGGSADRWEIEETYVFESGRWMLDERKTTSYNVNQEPPEPKVEIKTREELGGVTL